MSRIAIDNCYIGKDRSSYGEGDFTNVELASNIGTSFFLIPSVDFLRLWKYVKMDNENNVQIRISSFHTNL